MLAIAAAAALLAATVYYRTRGNDATESVSTKDARHVGAPLTQPSGQPAAAASSRNAGEEIAQDRVGATPGEPPQPDAFEEQVRSFTIPVERALAGIEDPNLKIRLPQIPEFKETLRQFAAESDDPDWSSTMETRIFSEISQATGLGAGSIEADCRATLCRVLLTNPRSTSSPRYGSFNELVDSFGLETVWLLAVPDESGTPINFAYIRRRDGAAMASE